MIAYLITSLVILLLILYSVFGTVLIFLGLVQIKEVNNCIHDAYINGTDGW